MAVDLAPIVAPLLDTQLPFGAAILAVGAALMSVAVVTVAVIKVLEVIRGQKFVGGRFYDNDVYSSAMQTLYTHKKKGGVLDRESSSALRSYQGLGSRGGRI